MPSRKADQIVQVLRGEILSGQRAPGSQLPTYDALIEQFSVTRPTVARVLKALRNEGLITVSGSRGVFVARTFPHHNRYLWVTSEQPGSAEWTSFLATILELIERGETGIPGEVIPLVGVDGRANNPAYQTLCDAVEHSSVAGLLVMNSAMTYLLPVLQTPGLPRVAIWAPLPHAALLSLDFDALIQRACVRLMAKGRRIAVISPHAPNLARTEQCLLKRGLDKKRLWALHVAPIGCERITELLFTRDDRPDAVFVTDDNLVAPLLAGLKRAKVRPGRDVYVLAHCNWPRPIGVAEGVEHIGFDVREVLTTAKACIDAQRAGDTSPGRLVAPRFANELASAKAARRAH
jgi:DNA-binding transcriptional regulator YhcF (GntR family)